MNKPLFTASTSLLMILAAAIPVRSQLPSSSPSSTMSPSPTPSTPSSGNIINKLQCGNRANATGEIALRGNGYYTAKDENGKYQTISQGYRFLSGALRGQSVVQYKKNTYLIDSKDEAKASALVANDRSDLLVCSNVIRNR
jgi:hypothetical protein